MKDYLILDPKTTFICPDSVIKKGAIIHPFSVITNSVIEENVVVSPFSFIENSVIKEGAKVFASVIESSIVESGASVGPFSHLRPNATIGKGAKIGNFVEVKNSVIGEKTKVSHLSYVGDADVGSCVNIGCGVVFVNFNGKIKRRTKVENKAFIGSSVNLIAPVKVGCGAFICAGTTIDKDVLPNSFVIGRSKMVEKLGRAKNYLE